jgi:GT2 family glycosyltransferase
LVIAIGGWRDLQWGEDVDFTWRIVSMGKSHYFPDVARIVGKKGNLKRGFLQRVRGRYLYYQCMYKIGFSVLDDLKADYWYKRPIELLIAIFALAVIKLKREHRFEYKPDQCARE